MRDRSVYLAGSSLELDRAQRWYDALVKAGIDVTSTWIGKVRATGGGNQRHLSPIARCSIAAQCYREVDAARMLWMLVPATDAATRGAWGEQAYAHALARPLVFSGDTKQSVFCAIGYEHSEDSEAFERVVSYLGGAR